MKLSEEAEGEAVKFLCMKGAVSYYVKDKAPTRVSSVNMQS